MAADVVRAEDPRCRGRPHCGLRWTQGAYDQHHLGTHGCAAVHRAPDPQQLSGYASWQRRDAIVRSLRPVYTAPSQAAAKGRFEQLAVERSATRRLCSCGAAAGVCVVSGITKLRYVQ